MKTRLTSFHSATVLLSFCLRKSVQIDLPGYIYSTSKYEMGAGQIRTGISEMRERYLLGITLSLKSFNLGELCVLPFKLQSPRKSITKAALAVNRHHRRQACTDENAT